MAMNSYSFNSQGNPTATSQQNPYGGEYMGLPDGGGNRGINPAASQQTNGSGGVTYGNPNSINAASYVPPHQNLGIGSPQAPKNFQSDWASNPYWNSTKAGDVTAYGGGNLTRNQDGTTTYAGGQGSPYTFGQNTSTADIAKNASGIANQWSNDYGGKPWEQNLGMGAGSAQPGTSATGAQSSGSFGNNPWLQQQGQAMQAQSNQNLKQNVLPGIGQGAQAQGMYGSSRQGTAEGIAMGNAQTGLNSALANMYSQSYGQDQQYDLGSRGLANQYSLGMGNLAAANKNADNSFALNKQQMNNSYDLGLRSNDLGYANLDANINNQNFSNQLQGAQFGLGIYDRMNGYNAQGTANGTQMQTTPLNYFNQFNNNTMAAAGTGGSIVAPPQGSPISAGLGAGLATYGMLNGQQTNPSTNGYTNNWYKP